jgi:primosomal protein N' (replication factor Y)
MESETASSMPPELRPGSRARLRPGGRASVLIPLALFTAYDYAIPEGLAPALGDFVAVPLGRRSVVGVVWGEGDDSIPAEKLRAIEARLDLPSMPDVSRRWARSCAWR